MTRVVNPSFCAKAPGDGARSLLERCAWRLTGELVRIRRREPVLKGAAGLAMKSARDGFYYVDLAPGLAGERLVSVLLHELAHIKAGDCSPSSWPHEPSGCIKSERVLAYTAALPRENKADAQAREWLSWAKAHAGKYDGDLLVTLTHYLTPEEERFMERLEDIALKAALEVVSKYRR
jgi:hypothetical protein